MSRTRTQRELEAKEAELAAAHEAARAVSAAVAHVSAGGESSSAGAAGGEGEAAAAAAVPEWKLREFEDLRAAVSSLWESLDVPAEDVTAFLSEVDLLAPFSPTVLDMYADMYARLTGAKEPNAPTVPQASVAAATVHASGTNEDDEDADEAEARARIARLAASAAAGAVVPRGGATRSSAGASGALTLPARGRGPVTSAQQTPQPPTAPSSFRTSAGSAARQASSAVGNDEAATAYLAKMRGGTSTLPPSLGGIGGGGQRNRSPSPGAGMSRAKALIARGAKA